MSSLTDRVKRNKEIIQRVNEEGNILHRIKRSKANWIADILCRNCFLKQVIEGRIEVREDEEGDINCCTLKEEALIHGLWGNSLWKGLLACCKTA